MPGKLRRPICAAQRQGKGCLPETFQNHRSSIRSWQQFLNGEYSGLSWWRELAFADGLLSLKVFQDRFGRLGRLGQALWSEDQLTRAYAVWPCDLSISASIFGRVGMSNAPHEKGASVELFLHFINQGSDC